MEPQCNCLVSGPLATMLRLSRCAGLAPLTFIKKQQGWSIRLSHAWKVYGYIITTAINAGAIASLLLYQMFDGKVDNALKFTQDNIWLASSTVMIVIASLAGCRARSHINSLISCINLVEKVKDELSICHLTSYSEKRNKLCLMLWMPFNFLLTILVELLIIFSPHDNKSDDNTSMISIEILYLFLSWTFLIMRIQEMQFIMVTMYVLDVFKSINYYMRAIIKGAFPLSAPLYYRRVRRLRSAYVSICDVVRELNRSYGLILILMLSYHAVCLNVALYLFIINLVTDESPTTVYKVLVSLIGMVWWLYHIVNIVLITEPCHVTHTEMEITKELVGVLMRDSYSTYQPLAVELEAFHRLLVLNQPSYTPLGVTTMSGALVLSSLASISTYLVVLLQLGLKTFKWEK